MKQNALFEINRDAYEIIAGVDEAGRGPLAGPVVAAAVILGNTEIPGITDSKKLTSKQREHLFELINKHCIVGIGIRDHAFIDQKGIKKATWEAMQEAVSNLQQQPELLLIDGNDKFHFTVPHISIIKGDLKEKSIGAASIIAKVTRDAMMGKYHELYPNYSFQKHKGYGTKMHYKHLYEFGLCEIHRKTYIHL